MLSRSASGVSSPVKPLSPEGRKLLSQLMQKSLVMPRLSGAPLELIGRQLAKYTTAFYGYKLEITLDGSKILKGRAHA